MSTNDIIAAYQDLSRARDNVRAAADAVVYRAARTPLEGLPADLAALVRDYRTALQAETEAEERFVEVRF